MPLTTIEIEEIGPASWIARVEVGGMISKRKIVTGASFEAILEAADDAYHELTGSVREAVPPMPPPAIKARDDQLPPLRDRSTKLGDRLVG